MPAAPPRAHVALPVPIGPAARAALHRGRRATARSPSARPAIATAALVVLILLLGSALVPTAAGAASSTGGPAARTSPGSGATPGVSRALYFAEQLRRDPVLVSPSLTRVADPAQVAALRREAAAMPYPTFVVIAPRFLDEPDLRSPRDLLPVLRDRLGSDGVYLFMDGDGYSMDAATYGIRTRGDADRLYTTVSDAVPRQAGPIPRARFALRHLRTGEQGPRSAAADRGDDEDDDGAGPMAVFVVLLLVGVALPFAISAATPGGRRRRAARRLAKRTGATGAGGRATLDAPTASDARRAAQDAVAGLARAIAEAEAPPDAALRAYDAASHLLARRRPAVVDHVGAAVLAGTGRALLRGRERRPCFFDPRHEGDTTPTRWRRDADEVQIPACARCARALERDEAPVSLADGGRPYWARDTVWARTGFGAIDDTVVDQVLAGGRRGR